MTAIRPKRPPPCSLYGHPFPYQDSTTMLHKWTSLMTLRHLWLASEILFFVSRLHQLD